MARFDPLWDRARRPFTRRVAAEGARTPIDGTAVRDDDEIEARLAVDAWGRLWIDRAVILRLTGWEAASNGWCRNGVCVPGEIAPGDDLVDLEAFAAATKLPVATHRGAADALVVFGHAPDERVGVAVGQRAPNCTLRTVDGGTADLDAFSGSRRVLLAFASWCGCRADLPTWDRLVEELRASGARLHFVAVALDESAEDARAWAEGVSFPVLLDRNRSFADRYGIAHVPTVIWIDEHDRIARSNDVVFADNSLKQHHGLDCSTHHEALRAWSTSTATAPTGPSHPEVAPAKAEGQLARAEFRLALWLLRNGRSHEASTHFDRAGQLAPADLAMRRAALALQGRDPFGPDLKLLYEEWRSLTGGSFYSRS